MNQKELDRMIKRVGCIVGNNESEYDVERFVTCLESLRTGESVSDFDDHVVDEFLTENGYAWEDRRYTAKNCVTFLGKPMLKNKYDDEDYCNGPFGGAFRDDRDYIEWKNGKNFLDD